MKKNVISKSYRAAIYLRLSKEDGDVTTGGKLESNSISNQKDLITDFLKSKPDIEVVSVRTDDGYSGVDFNRPEFQMMLEDVKNGTINCIVVKDLSRFGRNYIEAGRYLEKIFPMLGVRFIAVNDNYDSIDPNSSQDIMIAFKNLINDSYLRDLSTKIRSHLEVKRKNGEFIANYAVYGYRKDEADRNHLVVDPFAAGIVRDIFRMKLDGLSPNAIAAKLNEEHVLSPMEYKRSCGIRYQTSFKTNKQALWSAQAVIRILTNEVYTGVLAQGKSTTPNHKIKVAEKVAKKDWIRVENTHEPIIDKFYFEAVQTAMERDTRCSNATGEVYPLCGLIFCGDCGSPMIRKVNTGRKKYEGDIPKQYVYYLCKASRSAKNCTGHRIREDELLGVVFEELCEHIRHIVDVKDVLDKIDEAPAMDFEIKKYRSRIEKKQQELNKAQRLKTGIYEDLKEDLLDQDEYKNLKREFDQRIKDAEDAIEIYVKQIDDIKSNHSSRYEWMEHFREYRNIDKLSRRVAMLFINRILVYEDGRIKIIYSFADALQEAYEHLEELQAEHLIKEAV